MTEIQKMLFELQDKEYKSFSEKLMPTVEPSCVIGVRTPELRNLAKKLLKEQKTDEDAKKTVRKFLTALPHRYYEENNLHAFIIEGMKDYEECMKAVDIFLPYVDNWATCDQMSPAVFKKHLPELLVKIDEWIISDHTYTVRYGIGMLMRYYLDDAFKTEYPERVLSVQSDEYYVKMMVAWYFATALAKQYDAILPYIEQKRMETWTHNKAIQKAIESRRITEEQKAYLRSLKVKN